MIAISHIYLYATAIFIFHFITAQTYGHNFGPDALARKQCRARVLAALGRALGAGPHGPVPPHPAATTPSPSEPSPSLYLRPLGRYSAGARGAAAMQASALGASVNELIDTTFGCYPSSKSAGVVPKGVPTIWHKSTARHLAHALKLL